MFWEKILLHFWRKERRTMNEQGVSALEACSVPLTKKEENSLFPPRFDLSRVLLKEEENSLFYMSILPDQIPFFPCLFSLSCCRGVGSFRRSRCRIWRPSTSSRPKWASNNASAEGQHCDKANFLSRNVVVQDIWLQVMAFLSLIG